MTIIGFTGSRDLSSEEELQIERILWKLHPERVITGACIGVDEFVASFFASNMPDVMHTIYVPTDRSRVNMSFVDWMLKLRNVTVEFMPRGTNYRDRNFAIVSGSETLIGFPREPESHPKSQRSGTWQTIRMARGKMPLEVHVLSELASNSAAS